MSASKPPGPTAPPPWAAELAAQLDGEVDASALARRMYSQDASIYEQRPAGVVRPRHAADCAELVRFAADRGLSLIPRGGGTSLAGQCVGPGLVVEFTRHMNRVIEIDVAAQTAFVEPGVIQDDLNDAAAAAGGLMFAPDTSTSRQAAIGGMIGNNSCGAYSPVFGTTREHVIKVEGILADGSPVAFGPLDDDVLAAKRREDSPEGRLLRGVCDVIDRHRDLILARSPQPSVRRRNAGYALDALASGRPWTPDGPPFNLARLICGSEGTLMLVTAARLRLVPRPRRRSLMCVHFGSVAAACEATPPILAHRPAAIELMDGALLAATAHHPEYRHDRFWVVGDPGAVLAVELWDESETPLERRMADLRRDLESRGLGYAWPVVASDRMARVWALRKAGLGLLTGIPGDAKPVTAIEDIAVAPEDLAAFVREMGALMDRLGCSCVYYGHAAAGLLHYRPMLNLKDPRDLDRFVRLLREAVPLVRRFGGSISGEHGDGRLRSPLLREALTPELYDLCVAVKRLFDPAGVLNPGKIVDPSPLTADLRTSPATHTPEISTAFDWSRAIGYVRAAEACNGAGVCRQSAGRGLMCPTYMATGDEAMTTRARANLLRQALTGSDPDSAWFDSDLAAVLDTCVACKGCRSECPSAVDMARMKSEWLHQRARRRPPGLRAVVFGYFATLARAARVAPALASRLANLALLKRALGIAVERRVPKYASVTFSAWFRRHAPRSGAGRRGEIILFVDEFIEHLEPAIGVAAIELAEAAGWRVLAPAGLDSARALISKGFLDAARRRMTRTIERLVAHARAGRRIVGLEPSAILGFRDEAPDLVPVTARSDAAAVRDAVRLFPEWIAEERAAGHFNSLCFQPLDPPTLLIHGHCHQKSLAGSGALKTALSLIPDTALIDVPSACCGMAGSFGYEAEHYELSMRLGEQALFPTIRQHANALICADGTSCRQQILHGTGRPAHHSAEWLRRAMVTAAPDPAG